MKTFARLILGSLVLLLIASTVVWLTPTLRTQAGVNAQVWGLNLGLIPVKYADWGFLKLRSGKAGLAALSDLERHGATDKIRQTSVAVQDQWFEAGHKSEWRAGPLGGTETQEKETRFKDLHMPLDGTTLHQDLLPGQHIPVTFWQTWRYRLNCLIPPRRAAITGTCTLRIADITGDSQPEILLDTRMVGTRDEYAKPAIWHRLTVYKLNDLEWRQAATMRLCPVDQADAGDGQVRFSRQSLDMLWVNGHAVNLFDDDCSLRENSIPVPAANLTQARAMAPLLARIGRLPSSKAIPASLGVALTNRSIGLPLATEPPMKENGMKPAYQGLPPCFTAHDPKACVAMVADIDHDGSDDVVILDQAVRKDVSTWRLATLLMLRHGRWTVVSNHAACAEEGQKLGSLMIELKPEALRPIEFAGRLYLPEEPSDNCNQHYPIL